MSEGIPYADIVILALVAGFILLRLRSVLGQKSGTENMDFFKKIQADDAKEPIVQLPEKSLKPKNREEEGDPYLASLSDPMLAETLQKIKGKDPQFSATGFLDGAKVAFEMVFDAFAKGDSQTLKMLLSDDLYRQFSGEIDARSGQDNRTETTLVAITSKDIARATLQDSLARLTVRFSSEQITVVRDKDGKIIEGDPSEIHHVEDEWVFERSVTSKNPNWKIVET